MPDKIHIQFTRFSAFYSPLIATIAAGFLKKEGLEPEHSVAQPGKSAIAALMEGSAHVAQSALSQSFRPLERDEVPPVMHFAQINEKDGFFITARQPDPDFSWDKLTTGTVLVDHGDQPMAMFKYACAKTGVDYNALKVEDAGNVDEMDATFRSGKGDFIHQQGPAPQQLEHDGMGHVVASVGEAIGPVGFSSLAATRDWLQSDMARAFMRAYRNARAWLIATPAKEVALVEKSFFSDIDPEVLASTIATYQKLGNWSPHVEITKPAYEVTVDVFLHAGLIRRRHAYDDVVAQPPS